MPYDEGLAERIRSHLRGDLRLSERKMFGGLCFVVSGNMCLGIVGDDLLVRVGPDAYPEALAHPFAREMDFTGRSMKGFVYVAPAGLSGDDDLLEWLDLGLDYAESLPAK
jgi:TfoX/Sxy family transcriptional regulator of competence genes